MCGIAGFIDFNKKLSIDDIIQMTSSISHRGPDNLGKYFEEHENFSVGLGHARLSIIDLSVSADQPMFFENYVLVFNGEIYNYAEIKQTLVSKGHIFVTNSDTEIIIHAFKEWGIDCVDSFIGMFSICIYDKLKSKIYLIRDRVGVKPLYFFNDGNKFLFSSELKSFYCLVDFEKNIDLTALSLYFQFGYVPAPKTIFKNCFKLKPGHILEFDLCDKSIKDIKYWDVNTFYLNEKYQGTYSDAKESLNDLLVSACNYRMVSDVPVGVFLSGGYDSSGVAAILQKNRDEKLNTFTIGFEAGNNEAPFAKEIAKYLGTNHSEYYCTTKEGQEIIPQLPYFYDEPFADSSAIPTILVSKLARKDVTVALSADGGDEIFCGYDSYSTLDKKIRQLSKVPNNLRGLASPFLNILGNLNPLINDRLRNHFLIAAKSLNKSDSIQAKNLYYYIQSLPLYYQNNVFNFDFLDSQSVYDSYLEKLNPLENAMLNDFKGYLPDDILTKVDRATMSVALEGREPLLDHRIIEFAATLPMEFKFDDTGRKKIYKDIVHDYIPKELLDRPKMGFSLPINAWLRGEMFFLIEQYLNPKSILKSGLFNVDFVLGEIKKFEKNKIYYPTFIWRFLMFQMWYFTWVDKNN